MAEPLACDWPGCPALAVWDAPTAGGPWAYACGPHAVRFGMYTGGTLATRLEYTAEALAERARDEGMLRHPAGRGRP